MKHFSTIKSKSLSSVNRAKFKAVTIFGGMLAIIISALFNFQSNLNRFLPQSSISVNTLQSMEYQYRYMWNQRRTLINESSAVDMGLKEKDALPSRFLQRYFGDEIEILKSWKEVSSWNETRRMAYLHNFSTPLQHGHGDLLYGGLCDAILLFRETNGVRRHVLFSHFNENWGAFSTTVPNRTVNWGNWEGQFKPCKSEDLWWYLNHTNVSAIFTLTHQWLDHPKVLSLPLGLKNSATRLSPELSFQGQITINNRTELLLIALSGFQHRPLIAKHVIANFNGTIQNRFKDGSDYWENLRSAKYTLCPSGLGWDTYRAWEAIAMGSIPVLETYYRKDGFYRVYDDLPVLWVDHFDNVTPTLLESSYPKILARAKKYNFAKLTNQWWVDYINSFRFDFPGAENQPMTSARASTIFHSLPKLDVCDVRELSFNGPKMLLKHVNHGFIPKNGSIAYSPFMTKCSSTTLINGIKYATDDAPDVGAEVLSEEELRHYDFFSVLRHPMERALAGIHQVEIFWIMNWISGPIEEYNLTWWDKTCLNSTWGENTIRKHPCKGSPRETTTERRLQRLNDLLDEVEEKGFWDQHIAPMTYLIATDKFSMRSSFFDIAYVNNLTSIIAQNAGKKVKYPETKMKRGDPSSGQDWVFKWKDLVTLMPHHELAKSAVAKLCNLYQNDVKCLTYDVPECTGI